MGLRLIPSSRTVSHGSESPGQAIYTLLCMEVWNSGVDCSTVDCGTVGMECILECSRV